MIIFITILYSPKISWVRCQMSDSDFEAISVSVQYHLNQRRLVNVVTSQFDHSPSNQLQHKVNFLYPAPYPKICHLPPLTPQGSPSQLELSLQYSSKGGASTPSDLK